MEKDLLPFGWEGDELPLVLSSHLPLLIARKRGEEPPVELARVKVMRDFIHFVPGWELKDCIEMSLPQEFRYEVLRSYERVVKYGQEGYIFYI